ncbi:hypothetical protein E2C01_017859 [Portunus trituberculatus]|uniref:Secreted protein n=1 Tax=Portunus trituberculatus TaxID=210409 RepID=A0A5B7DUZ1_PORTR|nr:hypothetical protein [Portunus trituberculatus]
MVVAVLLAVLARDTLLDAGSSCSLVPPPPPRSRLSPFCILASSQPRKSLSSSTMNGPHPPTSHSRPHTHFISSFPVLSQPHPSHFHVFR